MDRKKIEEDSCEKRKHVASASDMGKGEIMKRVVLLITVTVMGVLLASGVALAAVKIGTSGDDVIRGTNGSDVLDGRSGNDRVLGLRGSDVIKGGPGNDALYGAFDRFKPNVENTDRSPDVISAGDGNDIILGGRGADTLKGGSGNDVIFHGPRTDDGKDVISGDEGNDFIFSGDNSKTKDVVKCGPGKDDVFADKADLVSSDCERVIDN
ncbi:MAG: calcium-binding protein [Rubrobacteraceae bacterium]